MPVSSLPPSALASLTPTPIASGSSTPISESPAEPVAAPEEADDSTADESVMTSKLSVSDYFRMKMREKMLARQKGSAASATAPESSTSLAVLFKEEVKVEVGGAAWEGSRTTFVEEATPVASTSTAEANEKEAKRRRKEEKRAKKGAKAALALTAAEPVQEIKSKKKKKKRAREDNAATPGSDAGAEKRSRKRKEGEATAETDGQAVWSGNDGGDSASGVDKPKKRRKDKS